MYKKLFNELRSSNSVIDLSIVIALYNESQSILQLIDLISNFVVQLQLQGKQVEIILVDDCSIDNTSLLVEDYISKTKLDYKLVNLKVNTGQVMALSAGISISQGKHIFVTDGDLQFPIHDCTRLLEKASLGSDLVCSVRKRKKSGWKRAFLSNFFGAILRLFFSFPLSEVGCNFRLISRSIIEKCREKDGLVRYSIMNFAQKAKKIDQIDIQIEDRKHGQSNYNFKKLAEFYLDLIIDSEDLVINGLILSLSLCLFFLVFYLLNFSFAFFESSFMTAPAQLFIFMALCITGLLNVYSVQKKGNYMLGIGIPEIDKIIFSRNDKTTDLASSVFNLEVI